MSHPYNEHRAHHVERKRVSHLGFASGGAVHEPGADEDDSGSTDRKIASKLKLKHGGHVDGKKPKHHLGKKAKRAKGGKVHGDEKEDRALFSKMMAEREHRARGGRTGKHKG